MSNAVTGSQVTFVNPQGLYDPSPYGYSHLALVAPGSRFVFVAGQGGETIEEGYVGDFRQQAKQALANLRTALKGAGADYGDVVKITVLIVDHSEEKLGIFGAEFAAAWGSGMKPAATLIPVPRLALDVMKIEIEAVAALPA